MKDQVLDGKYPNSVINVLTEIKQTRYSSPNHKGAAVWLFIQFMNGPSVAAIKER